MLFFLFSSISLVCSKKTIERLFGKLIVMFAHLITSQNEDILSNPPLSLVSVCLLPPLLGPTQSRFQTAYVGDDVTHKEAIVPGGMASMYYTKLTQLGDQRI